MAMSRKHYREAAEIIKDVVIKTDPSGPARHYVQEVAEGLARMFKADNSAFRREQFLEACGLSEPRPTPVRRSDPLDRHANRSGGLDSRIYG